MKFVILLICFQTTHYFLKKIQNLQRNQNDHQMPSSPSNQQWETISALTPENSKVTEEI